MKNKKGQMTIGVIVILVVGILFALALFGPIADTTGQMTKKQSTDNQSISTVTGAIVGGVNESINYSIYAQSAWKVLECPISSVVIRNGAGTALTAVTDYTLDASNARFSLVNTTKTVPATALNLTYADYTFCADGYNTDSGSRSIANMIPLFSALILMAFVLVGVKQDWFK